MLPSEAYVVNFKIDLLYLLIRREIRQMSEAAASLNTSRAKAGRRLTFPDFYLEAEGG